MEITVLSTKHSPAIDFKDTGELLLEGRAIPENAHQLFQPMIDFVMQLKVDEVKFDVKLEYFNTASSKMLMQLFKQIEANSGIKSININWYYEEGDDDSIESAEIYEESLLRSIFTYKEMTTNDEI